MGRLVCNGNTLYRRSNMLVRTPITLTLQPVEMAYYSVAGTYGSNNYPDTGFIAENTLANVKQMGYDMLRQYASPTDPRQIWRQVNTSHQPETVWYQGAFAPSARSIAQTYIQCEAYGQLGAYKFRLPEGLRGLQVTDAIVKWINGGAVIAYQSAGNKSNKNALWRNSSLTTDKTWFMNFAATATLGTPSNIYLNNPSDSIELAQVSSGTVKGVRDLWGFTGTNRDGAIPTVTNPGTQAIQFNYSVRDKIAANIDSGVWIVPFFYPEIYTSQDYRPFFWTNNNGYWGCVSVWGLTLRLTLE